MTMPAPSPIRFLLNGADIITLHPDPDLTVLEWLRNHRRLTGTKEGCAEGDCGACTVALGEAVDGKLRFRAINACIAMASQLHGKLLVSVEGLADGKTLHPVQNAMVEQHASQCGFCTPGFVMSLFARFHDSAPPDDEDIHDALAGNLCRCTGYRPVVDAARQALTPPKADRYLAMETALVEALHAIAATPSVTSAYGVTRMPGSRAELATLLQETPNAIILAGGTDLGLDVTKRGKRWPAVISLSAVRDLQRIERRSDVLRIGAAVTYSDLLPHFSAFGESAIVLLRRLGSRQIRNLGTIGGNIANASPIGDTPPLLLALNARVEIDGVNGSRLMPMDDFFIAYRKTALQKGEFIAAIEIPLLQESEFFQINKISRRFDQDISALCGAIWLRRDGDMIADARIAFGGMAEKPKRAAQAEAALKNAALDQDSFARAAWALAQDFTPIGDFRASAAYRMTAAQNLMRRWGMVVTETSAGNAA